ncbi:SDR family oxidoreductase [Hoeflea sp. CAU 1731]
MDLGISEKAALICGSSRGLGKACALSLAEAGCSVTINGRNEEALQVAASEIEEKTGRKVNYICADLNDERQLKEFVVAAGTPDILVTNNSGPAPGRFVDWGPEDWMDAMNKNMIIALTIIKHVLPHMREQKFGRIVNITSAMVKSPRPRMGLSTAARAGLTAACKALSIECAIDNVTINNMLPERFDTDRTTFMADIISKDKSVSIEEAKKQIASTIAAKRLGQPNEFGDTCAFICSQQAGYMSGQNIQLDGGSYAGLV